MAPTGLEQCHIIKHSGLSHLIDTPKVLQVNFYCCSYTQVVQLIRGIFHFTSSAASSGALGNLSVFSESFQILPGTMKDQKMVDQESSQLKKLEQESVCQEIITTINVETSLEVHL